MTRARRLREVGIGVAAVAAFLAALLVGGSGAAAQPAVTGPTLQNCRVFHCVTVSVGARGPNGSGRITTDPAGISCTVVGTTESGTCSTQMQFSMGAAFVITFIGTSAPGSLVCRDNCSGNNAFSAASSTDSVSGLPSTSLVNDHFFFKLASEAVTVTKAGEGTGTVVSDPARLACGATCVQSFDYGTTVKLTATPDAGASFTAWTGACAGQGATCVLTPKSAVSTNAVFRLATTSTTTTTTTATTTQATTGSTASITTTPTTATPRPSTAVDANLLAARFGRSRLGVRIAQVEVDAGEPLTASVSLTRRGARLAARTFAVRPGDRVLTLPLPGKLAKGPFVLTIKLTNSSGHTRSLTRTLRLTATSR